MCFFAWVREVCLQESLDDEHLLCSLAFVRDVKIYNYLGCNVNGVRFLINESDDHRTTQNSAVLVFGSHNDDVIDFLGVLIMSLS